VGRPQDRQIPPTNGAAIAGIILAFLVPPAGLVLGLVGWSQVETTGEYGKGLAISAVVVSGVMIVATLVAVLAWPWGTAPHP
jgi:hypothetical protein